MSKRALAGFGLQLIRKVEHVRRTIIAEVKREFGFTPEPTLPGWLGYAVFDADGTLWSGDLGQFFHWLRGKDKHYKRRTQRLMNLEKINSDAFYRKMTQALAGRTEAEVMDLATRYFREREIDGIFPEMRNMIDGLEHLGFKSWIVSGSPYWLVKAGARVMGLPGLEERVIGLRLKVDPKTGKLTSKIDGPVPWAEGKVAAIRHWISSSQPPAIAIGNCPEGDGPMMRFASHLAVAVNALAGAFGKRQNLVRVRAGEKNTRFWRQRRLRSRHGAAYRSDGQPRVSFRFKRAFPVDLPE